MDTLKGINESRSIDKLFKAAAEFLGSSATIRTHPQQGISVKVDGAPATPEQMAKLRNTVGPELYDQIEAAIKSPPIK